MNDGRGFESMSTKFDQELDELKSRGDGILVDVRDPEDYECGHVPGAMGFTMDNIRDDIRQVARFNTPILVYCYTGKRSREVETLLQSRGYEKTRSIGGIDQYSGPLVPALTVRELRERKGISQAELARTLGIKQPTVAAYESGKANPGPEICARIRRFYGVTISPLDKQNYRRKMKNKGAARRLAARTSGNPEEITSIRELRQAWNLTQSALAETLGIGTGTVAAYEAGRIHPGPQIMEKLRTMYGLELSPPERKKRKSSKGSPASARPSVSIRYGDRTLVLDEILHRLAQEAGEVEAACFLPEEDRIEWTKSSGETGSLKI